MERETYDLDDILAEVKQRRQQASPNMSLNDIEEPIPTTPETSIEMQTEQASPNMSLNDIEEPTSTTPETSTEQVEPVVSVDKSEEAENIAEISEEEATEETDVNEYIDLFSVAKEDDDKPKPKKKEKFFNTKKGKITKAAIIILVVLFVIAGIFGGIYIYRSLNKITDNQDTNRQTEEQWDGMNKLVESFPEIKETEAREIASLQDMIKTWYYNGDVCSSTHVLNVLLLGEDTRGNNILEGGTRADSAIILSINVDTGTITLTSVLRDAYAYWEKTIGDSTTGVHGKINGAMSIEGCNVHTYINCIEHLYKINIDNYVIVNFDSFKKIIDAMGGVTLELTSAEINEVNNHPKVYGNVYIEQTFEGDKGEMLLNGTQALAYCRIRHLDSDNMRADRQKTTLIKIFEQAQKESKGTLLKMVNALVPYVKTGFSKREVVSIAKYAFSEGWLNYEINMTSVPHARIDEDRMGGMNYGEWMWRPDYPQDAYYLQTLLYGKTNILLAQVRVDVVYCENYGYYSDGSYPVTATIYNEYYGVPTTYTTTTKPSTTTTTSN